MKCSVTSAALIVLICAKVCSAALVLHTNSTDWNNAVGALGATVDFNVNFNSTVTDVSFELGQPSFDAGPFTLGQAAGTTGFLNKIDALPLSGGYAIDQTVAAIAASGDRQVTIAFDGPVVGFAADTRAFDSRQLEVALSTSAGAVDWAGPGDTALFFGVTVTDAADAFSVATWSDGGSNSESFAIDNVLGAFQAPTNNVNGAIPEPSSFVAWTLLGLLGIGVILWRGRLFRVE